MLRQIASAAAISATVAVSALTVSTAASALDWVSAGRSGGQMVEYASTSISQVSVESPISQVLVRSRIGRRVINTYLAKVHCRDLTFRQRIRRSPE